MESTSIACGWPLWRAREPQTTCSIAFRVSALILGSFGTGLGILILVKIGPLNLLSAEVGWSSGGAGAILLLTAGSVKWVRKKQPTNQPTLESSSETRKHDESTSPLSKIKKEESSRSNRTFTNEQEIKTAPLPPPQQIKPIISVQSPPPPAQTPIKLPEVYGCPENPGQHFNWDNKEGFCFLCLPLYIRLSEITKENKFLFAEKINKICAEKRKQFPHCFFYLHILSDDEETDQTPKVVPTQQQCVRIKDIKRAVQELVPFVSWSTRFDKESCAWLLEYNKSFSELLPGGWIDAHVEDALSVEAANEILEQWRRSMAQSKGIVIRKTISQQVGVTRQQQESICTLVPFSVEG